MGTSFKIAEQLLGTPYVEGLLDRSQNETLSSSLQEFDCVLFVETVLAIATRVPGLDVTHTGFVYRSTNGEVGIIHAAPGRGVKLSPDLETYLHRVEDAIGVIVARPVENC